MRYTTIAKKILEKDYIYNDMSNTDLRNSIAKWKKDISKGVSLNNLLPEVYAAVRESSYRTIGQKHYPVQIIGGISLHYGEIIEMKTGEGKTLTATLPAVLNSLSGKVHIITVNDYLAEYNCSCMSPIYEYMGLSAGYISADMSPEVRAEQYKKDILYGTGHEFCFDYLKDNMRGIYQPLIQQGQDYAIIDEIDCIMIDEAKIPLIISGLTEINESMYERVNDFVSGLVEGNNKPSSPFLKIKKILKDKNTDDGDYVIDRSSNMISLSEIGIKKADEYFKLYSYNAEDSKLMNCISNALRANYMLKKDKDYIVVNDKIKIIDPLTGRILENRTYNGGLHQALEAKEHLPYSPISINKASTTYKSYFSLYKKFSGMTGTAASEKKEFKTQYDHKVRVIPPNKKCIRKDYKDKVYLTAKDKYADIVKDVCDINSTGQPILIATSSISESEYISDLLKKENIVHSVLNAKQNAAEAEIVAKAGEIGRVTVATNMAGRGTDIILGGNNSGDNEKVKALGGLFVIGTQRNLSRRIDNQIIGRAGRQGDPGCSRFYISLQDTIIKTYKSGKTQKSQKIKFIYSNRYISHLVNTSQKTGQRLFSEQRKATNQIDDIDAVVRNIIYKTRSEIINCSEPSRYIYKCISFAVEMVITEYNHDKTIASKYNIETYLRSRLNIYGNKVFPECDNKDARKTVEIVSSGIYDIYLEELKGTVGDVHFDKSEFEKNIMLKYIDKSWEKFLSTAESFASVVNLYSYGTVKPLEIYKEWIISLSHNLLKEIAFDIVSHIGNITTKRNVHLNKLKNISIKVD